MTKKPLTNVASSIRQRLLNIATAQGEDFQRLLVRYANERLLYRLSTSPHASDFILKGAMLLFAWTERPTRATPEPSPHMRPKISRKTRWARSISPNVAMRGSSMSSFILGRAA